MSISKAVKYRHALLRTIEGTFYVTVPEDAEVDVHGYVSKPQDVFAEHSILVAIEDAPKPRAYECPPNPSFPGDQGEIHEVGHTPQSGRFMVHFHENGVIELRGDVQDLWSRT